MARLFFDLETTGLEDTDRITCAATQLVFPGKPDRIIKWHSNFASTMSDDDCRLLAEYIYLAHASGVKVCSFNGLSFDFKKLAAQVPDMKSELLEVAQNHYDLLFQHVCSKGYFSSLQSFLVGEGVPLKTMDGEEAASIWKSGNNGEATEAKKKVLDYVAQDCVCLSNLFSTIDAKSQLHRITKSTKQKHLWVVPKLLTVQESLAMWQESSPDVSWMDSPPIPAKIFEWQA